jgi:hypothetical protein
MNKAAGFDYYLNWIRTLVAEMNAAIGCFHSNAEELKAAECKQVKQTLLRLRKMRDNFEQTVALQRGVGPVAWKNVRSLGESHWTAFETELAKNARKFGEKSERHLLVILQQQAVAQRKTWRDFVEQLNALV